MNLPTNHPPTLARALVWDLPVRLFHGLFGLLFVVSFAAAQFFGERSAMFSAHMLLGLVLVFLVLLRLMWAVIGTRYARLGSLVFTPAAVMAYVVDAVRGKASRYAGHNPGAGLAALMMFGLTLGLGVTGIMMASGNKGVDDVHEAMAIAFLGVVIVHLAGVALHAYRHRENVALTMIDGRKEVDPSGAIPSARPIAGLAFLALTAAFTLGLIVEFDAAARTLTVPGLSAPLQLGKREKRPSAEEHKRTRAKHDGD